MTINPDHHSPRPDPQSDSSENWFLFARTITQATVHESARVYADTEEQAREILSKHPHLWGDAEWDEGELDPEARLIDEGCEDY